MRPNEHPFELSRFGEPATLILLALSSGPKHGYGMMQIIEVEMGFKLGPGTLYGAIAKLMKMGLIRRVASDERAKPYEITDQGKAALAEFIRLWTPVVKMGQEVLA